MPHEAAPPIDSFRCYGRIGFCGVLRCRARRGGHGVSPMIFMAGRLEHRPHCELIAALRDSGSIPVPALISTAWRAGTFGYLPWLDSAKSPFHLMTPLLPALAAGLFTGFRRGVTASSQLSSAMLHSKLLLSGLPGRFGRAFLEMQRSQNLAGRTGLIPAQQKGRRFSFPSGSHFLSIPIFVLGDAFCITTEAIQ